MPQKRSPEGKKKHAAKCLARKIRLRKDTLYRAKEAERARIRYHLNKDKYKDIALKSISKRRSEINAKRREKRRLDPTNAKLNDKKYRANSVKGYITKLRRGEIGLDEFNRRIGKHFDWYDERIRQARRIVGDDGLRSGEADNPTREIEA